MAREKNTVEKKQNHIFEIILITVVTIGWIVWRVLMILPVDENVLAQSEYIINAFVENGAKVFVSGNPIELGYLYVLHGIFYVVGNHASAVLWLQFALHLIGAFVLYRGIRKLLGRVVAVLVYIVTLFLPCILVPLKEAQPLWLVFLAGALVIYLIAAIIDELIKKKNEPNEEAIKADEKESEAIKTDEIKAEEIKSGEIKSEEVKPKVKLLDNPLPGPKKHVSKVLDYDLKLERMPRVFQRYDIKVSDDDDFDIK